MIYLLYNINHKFFRISHKRNLSSSKEYHNGTIMKKTFEEWRYQLHMRISLKHHIISMQRLVLLVQFEQILSPFVEFENQEASQFDTVLS